MSDYKHKEYKVGIKVTPDNRPLPIPIDRRCKPHPFIRKHKLQGIKTIGDYWERMISYFQQESKKAMETHMKECLEMFDDGVMNYE